jgi:hypothetical protein
LEPYLVQLHAVCRNARSQCSGRGGERARTSRLLGKELPGSPQMRNRCRRGRDSAGRPEFHHRHEHD